MMPLQTYLIIGSYLMGAGSWMMLWREIKSVRSEILAMRIQLAQDQGLEAGRDHEARITRLERAFEQERAWRGDIIPRP